MKKRIQQNTEQLHIILSRAITTKIQLLSSTIGHIYVLWLICRQMFKAMQSEAYARKVKITNLQQMANTLIYIQEHGYDTRENLSRIISDASAKLNEAQESLDELSAELKTLNSQIHYTGQYFSSKGTYTEFIRSRSKKKFRSEHASELQAYEQARDWLKSFYN